MEQLFLNNLKYYSYINIVIHWKYFNGKVLYLVQISVGNMCFWNVLCTTEYLFYSSQIITLGSNLTLIKDFFVLLGPYSNRFVENIVKLWLFLNFSSILYFTEIIWQGWEKMLCLGPNSFGWWKWIMLKHPPQKNKK